MIDSTGNRKPFRKAKIRDLLTGPILGQEIEERSFALIESEIGEHPFAKSEWEVVRRLIHTSADFALAKSVRFSKDAIEAGIEALRKLSPIYVDSKMARAALSIERLKKVDPRYESGLIHCHLSDEDVMAASIRETLPRSLFAIRKAKKILNGSVVAIGNSPVALLELNRLIIEEGVRPALVIAMPVGFVNVEESKEEFLNLNIPHISILGRRGGSPLAVSVIHTLSILASGKDKQPSTFRASRFDAVILLGHGSRVPGADRSMLLIAEDLKREGAYPRIETCNMSRLGPSFQDVLKRCVLDGSKNILLLPYFLNEGLHMKLDIPSMLQKSAEDYPNVRLVFGKNLGYDALLCELVKKRIAESEELEEIRGLSLPKENDYPLEAGEMEFVAMLPGEAMRWKKLKEKEEDA